MRYLAIPALLALGLLASGCPASDSSTDPTPKPAMTSTAAPSDAETPMAEKTEAPAEGDADMDKGGETPTPE